MYLFEKTNGQNEEKDKIELILLQINIHFVFIDIRILCHEKWTPKGFKISLFIWCLTVAIPRQSHLRPFYCLFQSK